MKTQYKIAHLIIPLFVFFSCQQEETKIKERKRLNSFSMQVNGKDWKPNVPGGDVCETKAYCYQGGFSGTPMGNRIFYEIIAYSGSIVQGIDIYENRFSLQVTDANRLGVYDLTDSYKADWNYALFNLNVTKVGASTRYVNSTKEVSFTIEIEEFIKTKANAFTGIKGKFGGVLYNEGNPLDSLVITNGQFTFIVGNGADQCDTYWLLDE